MPELAQDLRSSILQDAMKGKLTEQLETDSSVDELLRSIQLEKEQLIQEKKIKKGKPLSPISNEEIPFDIPDNWRWVYLQDVCKSITAGGDKPKKFSKTKTSELCIPIFSNGETNEGLFGFTDIPVITEPAITVSGRGTIGFSRVREANFVPIVRLIVITLLKETLNIDFLCLVLNTLLEAGQGTAVKQLTVPMICSKLIPIPPIEEQQRIVDKLNQIIPLIDEYEKLEKQLVELKKEFPDDIKAAILQAAMEGKLTEQLESDSSVDELLKFIQQEKALLIKEKKIKKEKPLTPVTDEEIPFDIPDSWRWTNLKQLVWNRKQRKPNSKFCYIDIGSIDNNNLKLNKLETIVEVTKAPSRARKPVQKGDIVYSTVRPYLHNMAIIDKDFSYEPIASTGFAAMVCHKGINIKYLFLCLQTPFFDKYANNSDNSKGVAYPAINDQKLYKAPIPLPPIEEQQRIVDKLDRIIPLIDELKGVENDKY